MGQEAKPRIYYRGFWCSYLTLLFSKFLQASKYCFYFFQLFISIFTSVKPCLIYRPYKNRWQTRYGPWAIIHGRPSLPATDVLEKICDALLMMLLRNIFLFWRENTQKRKQKNGMYNSVYGVSLVFGEKIGLWVCLCMHAKMTYSHKKHKKNQNNSIKMLTVE